MPSKKKVAVVAEPPVEAETTARKRNFSIAVPKSVPADAKAPAKVPAVKTVPKAEATKSAQKASATKADPKSVPGKAKSSDCSKETEKAAPPKVAAKGTDTKLKEAEEKVEAAVSAKTTAKAPSKANAATKKPLAAKISKLKNALENVPGPSTDKDEAQLKTKKPTYEAMMLEAAKVLDDKKGSSMQAIKKQMASIYSVNITLQSPHLKRGLDKLLEKRQLIRVSGAGLSGSFKLGKTTKPKKLVPPAVPDDKTARVRVDQITNGKPPAKSKPPAKPKGESEKASQVQVPTTAEEQVLESLKGLQLEELSSDSEDENDPEGENNNSSSSEEESISEHTECDEEEDWDWAKAETAKVLHKRRLFKNVIELSAIPEVSYNSSNLTDSKIVAASDQDDDDSSAVTSNSNESDEEESEHKDERKPRGSESDSSDDDSSIEDIDIDIDIELSRADISHPMDDSNEKSNMEGESDGYPSYSEGNEYDGEADDERSEVEGVLFDHDTASDRTLQLTDFEDLSDELTADADRTYDLPNRTRVEGEDGI